MIDLNERVLVLTVLSCATKYDFEVTRLWNLAKGLNLTMAFIKIANTVINTNYIAAVKLESETFSGERCVSILLATPKVPLLHQAAFSNSYNYEWLDFTCREAVGLKDYFSSFNNVNDLLPQHQEQPVL